jgi:hypothetical protein
MGKMNDLIKRRLPDYLNHEAELKDPEHWRSGHGRTPATPSGHMLAAFLHGLMPETNQFDRQIAEIEDEARDGKLWDA